MQRSGLLVGLLVSLAVNLFVIGLIVGVVMMGGLRMLHPGRPPAGGFWLMRGPMMAAEAGLSAEQRQAWITAMRAQAKSSGPKMHQARELRRDAWDELAADPVDAQAVLAGLDRSRGLEQQARAEMDGAVVRFAATLPAEQRKRIASALARPPMPHDGPGMFWLRGGGSGPGPGPDAGPGPEGGPGPGPGGRPPALPDR